jgi:heme exporter protein A
MFQPGAGAPIVELAGVDKVFGTHSVLREVDFSLHAGERVLVHGPNGAGKSTLLKVIASLSSPTAGSVRFYGSPQHRSRYRSHTAYLGHSQMLYPDLTGAENLAFFAALRGVSKAQIGPLLARVGLGEAADRRVRFYSAGMRQRLAIARLLVHDPEVLLLDEPFNALDGDFVEAFSGWISARTVVLVTHQLTLGLPLSTRTLRVADGRVHQDSPAGPSLQ